MKNFISDVELKVSKGKHMLRFYSRCGKDVSMARLQIEISEDRSKVSYFVNLRYVV